MSGISEYHHHPGIILLNGVGYFPVLPGAALLVDPASPEDISEKIVTVLEDADIQLRLRRDGLARAGDFSWDKNARETMAVYEEVVSG